MKGAKVVIGAGFGDEAKGMGVEAFVTRTDRPVVVRFNGGAQAGHTVTMADGRRHVFSHFGAGTLRGVPTFLSRFFVAMPGVFVRELAELEGKDASPEVWIDPDAQVTTPFDVFVNRWVEEARGNGRHGSVGIGFGETIERSERGFGLAVRDLGDGARMSGLLERIRREWLPSRLAKLGVEPTPERMALAASPEAEREWMAEVGVMLDRVRVRSIGSALLNRTPVFEGAQGLLLDMDRGLRFPYVTRSNTGLKNVLALAKDAGIGRLSVLYMTRTYLTRHGAGPLPGERPDLDYVDVVDLTNRPNPWQGTLRFAPLDLDILRTSIGDDLSDAKGTGISVEAGLGVSCVDQLRGHADLSVQGDLIRTAKEDTAEAIAHDVGLPLWFEGHGPTRGDGRVRTGVFRPERPAALGMRAPLVSVG